MKPFNIQAAIAGAPIQLETGEKITFIAYVPAVNFNRRLVYMDSSGNICATSDNDANIFMTPEVKTYWANVHRSESGSVMVGVSMPDEKAVQLAMNFLPGYVKTISFDMEE